DTGRDPARVVRRDLGGQRAPGPGAHQRGARHGDGATEPPLRRADPLAGGGRRALRARRLLRPRDAHRRPRHGGLDGGAAPAARRDRCADDRQVPHGHRQGRRARHRQEPRQHHAGGRGLRGDRPRRAGGPGEVRGEDPGAPARHRRVLGVPHHDHADVQGEHERAAEGRAARPGDRHGGWGSGDPGVRRRGRCRRLRRRCLGHREEGQGPAAAQACPGVCM
ncbi:MAG: 5-methyltetrahydrofolate--homocysteine methyltransferase, partial [uncultured Nocardioidaceae bacterium]